MSASLTGSRSVSMSLSRSRSFSTSFSGSRSFSASVSRSASGTASVSRSPSRAVSVTPSPTVSPSHTPLVMPPAAYAVACPGQATSAAAFTVSAGMGATRNVYDAWSAVPSVLGSTQLMTASPDAKLVYAFGNSSSTPATLLAWDRFAFNWTELSTAGPTGALTSVGLPAGAVHVYLADIAVTGIMWLALLDTAGNNRIYYHAPSREQLLGQTETSALFFTEATGGSGACGALPALGALVALPNGNALATSAAAPYTLFALGSEGCMSSLALSTLSGGAGRAPWALTVSATLFSVYSVLLSMVPTACVISSTCAGTATVYRHATSYANLELPLTDASDWTAVAMPSGAGIAQMTVAISSGKVYGTAPFCMSAATVSGCACGVGYPLLVTNNAGTSWAVAGCIPILPTSLLVPSDSLIYVAGATLDTSAPVITSSANGGGRWVALGSVWLPAGAASCSLAAGGLQLVSLAQHGGPIIISGLDNGHHGDPNDGPTACSPTAAQKAVTYPTCTATLCPAWQTFLTIVSIINTASTLASDFDLVVLGVDPTSAALSTYSSSGRSGRSLPGGAGAAWLTVCNLNLTASYWFGQSTQSRTLPDFFDALAWGRVRPSMIWIAESRGDFPITPSDQAVLVTYAAAIANFASRGGGLLSSAQYNGDLTFSPSTGGSTGPNYGFVTTMAPFITLGLTASTNLATPTLTAYGAGIFPGLVSPYSNPINPYIEGPWHQYFAGPTGSLGIVAVQLYQPAGTDVFGGAIVAVPPSSSNPDMTYFDQYNNSQAVIIGGSAVEFTTGTAKQTIFCTGVPISMAVSYFAELTCSSNSTLPIVYTITSGAALCTTDQVMIYSKNVSGTATIEASQPGNYLFAAAFPVSFRVIIRVVQLIFCPAAPATPKNMTAPASKTLACWATSGLAVTYNATAASGCTVTGTTVTAVAAGMCNITVSQAGNVTVSAANPIIISWPVYASPSTTPSASSSPTRSASGSVSPTLSASGSASLTRSVSISPSASRTRSASATASLSGSSSMSTSVTSSVSRTISSSSSTSPSVTLTM